MSFTTAAIRAAKAAAERAAPLAGPAAVIAASSPAAAREAAPARGLASLPPAPAHVDARVDGKSEETTHFRARIRDEFELVDVDVTGAGGGGSAAKRGNGNAPGNGNSADAVVSFRPALFGDDEIDGAAAALRAFAEDAAANAAPSDTSDGSAADAVIEAALLLPSSPPGAARRGGASARGARAVWQQQLNAGGAAEAELSAALAVAARVLRAPGVQREIAAAALSDPEVAAVLGARGGEDVREYLVQRGFACRGLLPGGGGGVEPAAATVVEELASDEDDGAAIAASGGRDPLAALVEALAQGAEWTAGRLAAVGDWLRAALFGEGCATENGAAAAAAETEGGQKPRPARSAGARLLERAGQIAVLLVLVMILRRAGVRAGFPKRGA